MTHDVSLRALRAAAGLAVLLIGLLAAEPQTAHAQTSVDPYQIQAGDRLSISVWKEEELQNEVVVRPDGRLTFPLAGEITASGKTVIEVTNELLDKLQRYIPDAVVTVSLIEIRGARVYVIGQVQRPGEFLVNPRVDVMQALSMAGGLTAFASANDIRILRRTANEQVAFNFRYQDVVRGRSLDQNVLLQDGDVVVVP